MADDMRNHEDVRIVHPPLCGTYSNSFSKRLLSFRRKKCHVCRCGLMVRQLICNQLIIGSNPVIGLAEHSAFGDLLFAAIIKRVLVSSGLINRVPLTGAICQGSSE